MKIKVRQILLPNEQARLIDFLCSENWPFHVNARLSPDRIAQMPKDGIFDGLNHRSFWIENENQPETLGFIRLSDLNDIGDGYPLFDLRVRASVRGMGVGVAAVKWLTHYLSEEWLTLDRIAGTTRSDNAAMRKVFRTCGYVKEGHFRKNWAGTGGVQFDTVKYCILREDWASGKITPVMWDDEPIG